MGKLRKKLTLGLMEKVSSFASIIFSFVFAGFLGYNTYFKDHSKNMTIVFKIGFYFFMILGIAFTIAFIISCLMSLNISLYEEGIFFITDKEMLLYSDMPTFYFIPFDYLVVRTKYDTSLVFERKKVGDDFFHHFENDYIKSWMDKILKKIEDGEKIKIGFFTDHDLRFVNRFKFKFLMKNLKFKKFITIDKEKLSIDEKTFNIDEIKASSNHREKILKIEDKDSNVIFENHVYYIEKTFLIFEIIQSLKEKKEIKKINEEKDEKEPLKEEL